ncbi:hypothetical protein JCM5353_000988 [Sporobolomyces roseus]
MSSSSFAHTELEQALSEIPWGYKQSSIHPPSKSKHNNRNAIVDLQLLCDRTVEIECSEAGWKVLRDPQGQIPSESAAYEAWWDTLDNLLIQISPEFERKRMEKLLEKLNQHAELLAKVREEKDRESDQEENDTGRGEYRES